MERMERMAKMAMEKERAAVEKASKCVAISSEVIAPVEIDVDFLMETQEEAKAEAKEEEVVRIRDQEIGRALHVV